MNTVKDYKIPKYVTDQVSLEILMENMKKMDREQYTKHENVISNIKVGHVISTLGAGRIKQTF